MRPWLERLFTAWCWLTATSLVLILGGLVIFLSWRGLAACRLELFFRLRGALGSTDRPNPGLGWPVAGLCRDLDASNNIGFDVSANRHIIRYILSSIC